MSQHSSLRIDPTRTRHRNVLKRHERIRKLMEQDKWKDRASALGLPKVKSLKIKMKKIKEEKAAVGTEAAAPNAAAAAQAPAPQAAAPAAKKKPGAEKAKPASK
ncbi:MAG: small basic protein [Candidatus Omnitrophica bacterium]|nr:small basic protein [Candidatus Omnitrophota bacterium]